MNLHILSENPQLIPPLLDDKRVGKMLMEANQMLSLAAKLGAGPANESIDIDDVGPGKLTEGYAHANHPVSEWVRFTVGNFDWTVEYALALAAEFKFRFGKDHGSAARTAFIANLYRKHLTNGPRTPFQNSARNQNRDVDFSALNVIDAYMNYMIFRWSTDYNQNRWTKRGIPDFFKEYDMKMPANPRVGYWGNFGFHKAFHSFGHWTGSQLPPQLVGSYIEQELDEGKLRLQVNVLYDASKPKRERLETVLVVNANPKPLVEAMWLYDSWEKVDNGPLEQASQESAGDSDGVSAPW